MAPRRDAGARRRIVINTVVVDFKKCVAAKGAATRGYFLIRGETAVRF
jgi:hypothetical protein